LLFCAFIINDLLLTIRREINDFQVVAGLNIDWLEGKENKLEVIVDC